jgi:hypothetical protein
LEVKDRLLFIVTVMLLAALISDQETRAQTPDKLLITHSSESISITPLIYGTINDADLQGLLEETKQEAGVKRAITVKDIVDYSLLRRAAKEIAANQ